MIMAAGPNIGFIGFGEAAQAFVRGWRQDGATCSVSAYDILFEDASRAEAKKQDCRALGVSVAASPTEVAQADMVISAVTADQVQQAAGSILPAVRNGLLFLDINSAAPFRKVAAARPIADKGGRVVDVAVMAPVHPRLHRTPLLLSGEGAEAAATMLTGLKMNLEVISSKSGDASTVKMVRSIAIKGIESVVMECMVAAVALGVCERVVPTITEYLARTDFPQLANHVMERVAVHGRRRAAEMREVVATLQAAGLSHHMPAASAAHQQFVADLNLVEAFDDAVPTDALLIANAVLAKAKVRHVETEPVATV
mgnify:CR=1 FL=1